MFELRAMDKHAVQRLICAFIKRQTGLGGPTTRESRGDETPRSGKRKLGGLCKEGRKESRG